MMERPAWQRAIYQIYPLTKRALNGILIVLEKVFIGSAKTIIKQIKQI